MWQSRVYGFIFRTVLGPYLTKESRSRLHKSLNISLSEGRLEIFDIELNGAVVSQKLKQLLDGVMIDKIHIQRLRILLSICYFDEYGNQVDSYDDGKVRLVANVDMDGVMMDVSTSSFWKENVGMTNDNSQHETEETNQSRSYFQSALDSLKLNLNMNDVTLRVHSEPNACISLNVSTVNYHDSESRQVETSDPLPDMLLLSKHIGIDTVTVTIESKCEDNYISQELLRLDDQILMNITAKSRDANDTMNIERNIDIQVKEVLDITVRMETLLLIYDTLSSFLCTKNGIAFKECIQSPSSDSSSFTSEIDVIENEFEPDASMHNTFFSRHNDDTYMDHVRLSQNQNQLDSVVDDDLPGEKDIFTTNGPGFSHYHSLVASINVENNESSDHGMISTSVHIHVESIRLSFFPKQHLFPDEASEEYQEYVVCSIHQFDFLNESGVDSQKTTIQVNNLSIDYVADDLERQQMLPILGFPKLAASDDDVLISDSITLVVRINDTYDAEDECVTRCIHASIQPICITLWKSVILNIASDLHQILQNSENSNSSDSNQIHNRRVASTTNQIVCEHVSVRAPIEHARRESNSYNAIFSRCGYAESQDIQVAFLALDINMFELNLSNCGNCSNLEDEDFKLRIIFEEAVGYVADQSLRFDIFSLESETKIDSNAVVRIEWMHSNIQRKSERFKKDRTKTIFPNVVLLSTVKSSQREENENEEYLANPAEWNICRKKTIRGSDPSKEMMRTASKTESILTINIPLISVDISRVERNLIMKLVCFMLERKNVQSYSSKDSPQNSQSTVSVNVQCDQISISLHEDQMIESPLDPDGYSFMIVADSFRFHSAFENSKLMQVRALFSDLTLFEGEFHSCCAWFLCHGIFAEHFHQISTGIGCKYHRNSALVSKGVSTVQEKCVHLKRRRWRSDASIRVIFFRSKLSSPLSPDTPCIHVDLVCRREEDQMDILVYAFIYDMTHRFDVENHWVDRLTSHLILDVEEADQSDASESNTSNIISVSSVDHFYLESI